MVNSHLYDEATLPLTCTATFLQVFRKPLGFGLTLTDFDLPIQISDYGGSLNPSIRSRNIVPGESVFVHLCWVVFLYLEYMGHFVSFIVCQSCVSIDVLNFWETSGLLCGFCNPPVASFSL